MPCLVEQYEPEVAVHFGPTTHLPVNGPYFLPRPFPVRDIFPSQTVQVLQHSGCIHYKIVLAVVDEYAYVPEHDYHIRCVAFGDVSFETVVDLFAAWDVVNSGRYSYFGSIALQKLGKRFVSVCVLSEIVVVHASEVFVLHFIVVGEEVEELCGLGVVLVEDVDDAFGLEPVAGVSELVADNACTVEEGVVVVELVGGVGPAVADGNPFELFEGAVKDELASKGGDVVAGKGLTGDVERGGA